MGDYHKLDGQIGTEGFQLDVGNDGPRIKNSSGTMQIRNAADSALTTLDVAAPTSPEHAATKLYADSISKPLIVTAQFDGDDPIPSNTGTLRYLVVTTTGTNADIGEVLYDDGTSTGTMTVLAAENGRTISTTTTLSGGTITLTADSIYQWDGDGSSGTIEWVKIGDIGNVSGAVRTISYVLDNSASQDSTAAIPAGAYVIECRLTVTTAYSGGSTIEIGTTTDADAFQATTDNKPTKGGVPNRFVKDQETLVASASVVRTAVTGTPAAGAGRVTVLYTEADV